MEGDRTEHYRQVANSLPPMQKLILALDSALTGIPPERCVGQYHHQPATVEEWIQQPGGNPLWYLSDSGYSRIVWSTDKGDVFLTYNSTSKVKANWDKAAPERKALEDYLNAEYKRLLGESRPAEVVNTLLETDDDQRVVDVVKGITPETDDTNYGAALRELDAIAAKAKESDQKYGDLRKSLAHYLPKMGGENTQGIADQTAKLDDLYAKRRHTLAQIRYALHYRWALRKAGVKPEDVVHRFSSRKDRLTGSKPGIHVYLDAVETKDGRRVPIEPFEIPHELLRF